MCGDPALKEEIALTKRPSSGLGKSAGVTCRDPDEPGASLAFLAWDGLSPWQLLIFSLAARAALTRPAALSLVAHVASSGALCRPASLTQALRALRPFGGPSMDPHLHLVPEHHAAALPVRPASTP